MTRSWNDSDDHKLAALFRKGPNRGGVGFDKWDAKTCHRIRNKHFDFIEFKNFSPLFKRKCAKWNLDRDLTANRRGKKENTNSEAEEGDSSSEGSSYEDSDRDDEADGWFDDDIEEGEEEDLEEEEEVIMPKKSPKRSPKKSPVRAAKKKAVATIADITTGMDSMGVDSSPSSRDHKSFDMNCLFPRMRYQYVFNRIKRENFEFFVPTYPNEYFKPWIDDTGWWLMVKVRVVPLFVHPNRQLYAMANETNHNQDTHSNTAYQGVCSDVVDQYNPEGEVGKEIWSEPIAYPLKFKCKSNPKELIWDVQNYPNNTVSVDEFGGQQWFACLCVCVTSVDEPKANNKGTRRLVEAGDSLDALNGFSTPTNGASMEEE